MKKIYDHQKLCQHKKMIIPLNIRLGEMMNELLNGVNPKLLKKVIISLKKQYLEEHDDILNTREKKDHVQTVLDNIAGGKYNFAKKNIEEGEKFNDFYTDVQIPLPAQEKPFQCAYCKERYFKKNASLHSHYRSCSGKNAQMENQREESQVRLKRNEGFRPVKRRQTRQTETKPKKVAVEIIRREVQEEKREVNEVERVERNFKREKPVSTFSFGSDIFFEDN